MKILLATGNKDKVKEIKNFYSKFDIYALSDVLEPFEIVENGDSFKENALIKARAVYNKLKEKGLEHEFISLSDDSGVSVEALDWAPGIYSARYSGPGATDASNRAKIAAELHARGLKESPAFYTACIAIASEFGEFCAHGFMHGKIIDEERGENGFGYDFMFIPKGFNYTVGELSPSIKAKISHRSKGLELARYILETIQKIKK